jgi:hypothetical protein
MKNIYKSLYLILISFLFISCSKNSIDIILPIRTVVDSTHNCNCPNGNSNNNSGNNSGDNSGDSTGTQNTSLISFTASVEGLSLTKAMSPIQTNVLATMYAYDSASLSLKASGNYISQSIGTFSGVNGYKMYLPNGSYDFYAVSTNEDVQAPSFSNFVSVPLKNGIDYLWWNMENGDVQSDAISLNIVFLHKATQIVFNISEGDGIEIDSLSSITTTAPVEGQTMNLKTGVITPATDMQVGFVNQMGINGLVAQSILLPAVNMSHFGVIIKAFINGNSTESYYGVQIPIPNSTLEAGNSYVYSLILNASDVTTSSVQVAEWTVVKDNIPLYPDQIM